MTSPTEIKRHLDDALGNEPKWAIIAVRKLMNEDLPWLQERAVRMARADAYTWARLGRLMGKSRQAVRQAFGAVDGTPQPLPHRPMYDDDRAMATYRQGLADLRRRREFEELADGDAVAW